MPAMKVKIKIRGNENQNENQIFISAWSFQLAQILTTRKSK